MHTPRPKDPTPITVVDLFAGCGGFTQGFHEFRPDGANDRGPVFRSVAAVEHNVSAAATYAANFGSGLDSERIEPALVHVGDIENWTDLPPEALDADVVVGGPPCQGFSALNRKKKGAERNRLWEEYVRVVAQIRPKVFVIENVDRFLKSDEFRNLLSQVEEGGLLSEYRLVDPPGLQPGDTEDEKNKRYLLNAADYGAAQARKRTIVIGVLAEIENGRAMTYPVRTHVRRPKARLGIADQPISGVDTGTPYWRSVRSVFQESYFLKIRGTELPDRKQKFREVDVFVPGIFTTRDLHFGRNPEPLSRARYLAIPEGGNRKDLRDKWYTEDETGQLHVFGGPRPKGVRTPVFPLSTPSWDSHNTGTGDVMGRLRVDEPSVTIRTEFFKPEKGRYLHPTAPRPITHYEAARIQGFPLGYRWCGSKTDIAKQIGNAVPIPLGSAIASAIHDFLRG
ncbi:DNA cytosine methyltransferase [Streptomyces sp. NPDC088732]|uniref:DNA cytosine methyltransferase n=1 Tax=Streptomyces sp. NPDC088732 TaxID=3365879 RepID=UPI0038099522